MTKGGRGSSPGQKQARGTHEDSGSELQRHASHAPSVDVAGEDDSSGPAVRAVGLTKHFDVRGRVPWRPKAVIRALRNATLSVAPGTIHGVVGPNGSGKTTLLRILATLVIADTGDAFVCGHDVDLDAADVRRSIGFTTGEERSLYWRLTARQNLEFVSAIYRLPSPQAALRRALGTVGLLDVADRPVSGFSQGMSRRLGLARALLHEPDVLLLDEPTRSLDPAAREEFQEVLKALRAEHGVTTLLTTHDVGEAISVCDRVSVLRDGVFVEHLGGADEAALHAALLRHAVVQE
jgi:ABC-2 type transport system ATP-binding protein